MYLKVEGVCEKESILKIKNFIKIVVKFYYKCFCFTAIYFVFLPNFSFVMKKYELKSNETFLREIPFNAQ